MSTVRSLDGTAIAFESSGTGAPVILIDGALSYRGSSPNDGLATALSGQFTVFTYDRRGRGQSTDTQPYAVERELEDVQALIDTTGGSVRLFGLSSGAALALEAAGQLTGVERVAVYEVPAIVDAGRPPLPPDYERRLTELVGTGQRGRAVKYFMRVGVALPAPIVGLMPLMPAWKRLKAVAHTLPYDAAVMRGLQDSRPVPAERWRSDVPTLLLHGSKTSGWIKTGMESVSAAMPGAQTATVPGQTHIVKAGALAPLLVDFLA